MKLNAWSRLSVAALFDLMDSFHRSHGRLQNEKTMNNRPECENISRNNLHNTFFSFMLRCCRVEDCCWGYFCKPCRRRQFLWFTEDFDCQIKRETKVVYERSLFAAQHLHTDKADNFAFLFRIGTVLTSLHFIIIYFDLQRCFEEIIFCMNFHRGLSQNGFGVGIWLWNISEKPFYSIDQ